MNYKSCWARALLAGKISQLGVSASPGAAPGSCSSGRSPLTSCVSPDARGKHLAHPGKTDDVAARGQEHSMPGDMDSQCPGPAPSLCTRLGTPRALGQQEESQAVVPPCSCWAGLP